MGPNGRTVFYLVAVALFMLTVSLNAKVLYDTFCKVTGYGGTTRTAESNDSEVIDRLVTVKFDSNISPKLAWEFTPEVRSVELKVGQSGLAYYKVKNLSNQSLVGTATYNVAPIKAAPYFIKTECFCFQEQRVEPGEEVTMPVFFHVDSQIDDESRLDDVNAITLSYTFFKVENPTDRPAAQSRDAVN